ncbi:MAG: DUF1194 domain-containing protein [Alphaproteobacteria bacterium]
MPVDLELVLAVDVSGSIDEQEAQLQRQGYVDAIADPEVIRAIQSGILRRIAVTYFEWAGDGWQMPVLDWTVIGGPEAARNFAQKLKQAPIGSGPWTSISDAIDFSAALFLGNGLEGTRRIIDISGDGPNNTGGLVVPARDEAVAKRITINGLPIVNDRFNFSRLPMPNLDLYYRHCVIGGPGAFMVVANGFRDFARAIRRKLILEIASRTPPPHKAGRTIAGFAQSAGKTPKTRWVPRCDEGERRFRGIIDDE